MPEEGPERRLLGETPRFTAAEVAEQAGLPLEQARRLWRTLGFAEHGDAAAYTTADVEALRLMRRILDQGFIDFDLALSIARGVGLTISRISDWEDTDAYTPVPAPRPARSSKAA